MAIQFGTNHRGFLRLIVLNELSKEPSTGYSLLSSIKKITGKKPSTGSVYPLLFKLEKEGHVKSELIGKSKIYSINPSGKRLMRQAFNEREEMMVERLKYMTGIENGCSLKAIFSKKDENPVLERNISDWMKLKTVALSLIIDKDYEKKRNDVKKVISKTIKELERIRDGTI